MIAVFFFFLIQFYLKKLLKSYLQLIRLKKRKNYSFKNTIYNSWLQFCRNKVSKKANWSMAERQIIEYRILPICLMSDDIGKKSKC